MERTWGKWRIAAHIYMFHSTIHPAGVGFVGKSNIVLSMAAASTRKRKCFGGIKEWCIAWWHSGREDSDDYHYEMEDPSDLGYATPMSIETPLQSSVPRCTSMNIMNPYSNNLSNNLSSVPGQQASRSPGGSLYQMQDSPQPKSHQNQPPHHHQSHYIPSLGQLQEISGPRESRTLPNNNNNNTSNSNNNSNNRLGVRSVSQDSVYTILIRLPPDGGKGGDDQAPSIKMIQDDVPTSSLASASASQQQLPTNVPPPPVMRRPLPSRDSEYSLPLGRRMSHAQPDLRIPLNAKVIPKNLSKPPLTARQAKKKKKTQEKRQEQKQLKHYLPYY
uniref:Uncharacterized protein n=1 Tax=Megaselia scalaris TaxID=36166 RepID=T1GT97_MEGSC